MTSLHYLHVRIRYIANGALIGIVVLCVILTLSILICLTCVLMKRKAAKRKAREEEEETKRISIIGKNHKVPGEVELQEMRKISTVSSVATGGGDLQQGRQEYDAVIKRRVPFLIPSHNILLIYTCQLLRTCQSHTYFT